MRVELEHKTLRRSEGYFVLSLRLFAVNVHPTRMSDAPDTTLTAPSDAFANSLLETFADAPSPEMIRSAPSHVQTEVAGSESDEGSEEVEEREDEDCVVRMEEASNELSVMVDVPWMERR